MHLRCWPDIMICVYRETSAALCVAMVQVGQEPEDMPGAYGGSQSGGRGSFRG